MGRPKKLRPPLPTVWRVSDDLWELLRPVLEERDPQPRMGRKRMDQRPILDAVIFRLRSGCQWNHLPKELPDDSTVHRTFQRWVRNGVLEQIWAKLVSACDELDGVDWRWQAADAAMGKARFGGISSGPTPPTAASAA
jgi:putative transposase